MTDYTSMDIVNAAIAGEGNAVKTATDGVLMGKVADALDVKRTQISRNWLSTLGSEETGTNDSE